MDNETPTPSTAPTKTFARPRWKHFIRYGALAIVVFVDCGFISSSVRLHVLSHAPVTVAILTKEIFGYFLLALTNAMVLPRIIFEADRVDVDDSGIVFHNLLYKRRLPWQQIVAVNAPVYLKFAIIKTTGVFQLINKKDMSGFDELIQTIQTQLERRKQ